MIHEHCVGVISDPYLLAYPGELVPTDADMTLEHIDSKAPYDITLYILQLLRSASFGHCTTRPLAACSGSQASFAHDQRENAAIVIQVSIHHSQCLHQIGRLIAHS